MFVWHEGGDGVEMSKKLKDWKDGRKQQRAGGVKNRRDGGQDRENEVSGRGKGQRESNLLEVGERKRRKEG